jgi:predicted metal-binding membrane protein
VLGLALVGWLVAADEARGMDMGPGTPLGPFVWFLGMWAAMSVAMMLPSIAPAASVYARLRNARAAWTLLAGYIGAWVAYGAVAYLVYGRLRGDAPSLTAAALIAAGLYQLTPLKHACLRRCRSPFHLLIRGETPVVSGVRFGGYCIGCCAGLMLALFAVGIMNLVWMAVATVAILVEKLVPRGERFAQLVAAALVVAGLAVAL